MKTPAMTTSWRRQEGSALMIAVMVSVILTLLGLSFLILADQENTIAVNQRDTDQLLFVAEGGAKMVKAWFDRPISGDPNAPLFKFMGNWDMRRVSFYDRTKRLFDHDNDPNTAEVLADGTSTKPYFRQGLLVGGSSDPNFLTFWDKPYRGSKESEFRGLETGPDIVMESDTSSLDFLDLLNTEVIGDRATQERLGRIQKIEVYAPPVILVNGTRTRYGLATVKVTASKFRHMSNNGVRPILTPTSIEMARQVVKMVLNETPYPGPTGPFQSCTTIDYNGNLQIHWGEASSNGDMTIGPSGNKHHSNNGTDRSVPWATVSRYINGTTLTNWINAHIAGADPDFDPWYKARAGTKMTGTPNNDPQPYPYAPIPALNDDWSNLFQYSPPQCPSFDYAIWKNVAVSGGQDIHYLVWDKVNNNGWKEDGAGATHDFTYWTDAKEGFWFFDTKDQLPPDPNGTNLTPTSALNMSGGWSSAGFIYLNGHWLSQGTGSGVNRVIIPPGEPWSDVNGDKVAQADEYVNLRYPTAFGGNFTVYDAGNSSNPAQTATVTASNGVVYKYTTDPNARDDQGIPFVGGVHYQGVMFIAGNWEAQGNMRVFGSIVTKGGMITTSTGSPDMWFDERLIKGNWPPPELNLPRTTITVWQTEM